MLHASVTIVVVSYNSAHVLADCLKSLPADCPVVVVDNCSADNSADVVRRVAPQATLVCLDHNAGYGGAANTGLRACTTTFGMLINPDLTFHARTVDALLEAADRYPDAGMLGATAVQAGRIQWGRRMPYEVDTAPPPVGLDPEGDICGDYVGGGVMFFRMEAFTKVGGFDDRIFLYCEDDDICLKLRRAGYGLVQVFDAVVDHPGDGSSSGGKRITYWKDWHITWSKAYVTDKYLGRGTALRLMGPKMLRNALHLLVPGRRRFRYKARVAGFLAYLRGVEAQDVRIGPAP